MRVVVDANAIAHAAKFALGELTTETMKVGIIFGFLGSMCNLGKEFGTNNLCFAWDSQKSHRIKFFPEYKLKRRSEKTEKTIEEREEDKQTYAQFDLLYSEILPLLGVTNNYKEEWYEGDDLIASIVYNNPDDIVIVSGDEDMYQLLGNGVSIKKKKGTYTKEKFMAEYNIRPEQWIDVKCIAGCTSDEIPGIKGVGEKKAIAFIRNEMPIHHKAYADIKSPEGKAIRVRNEKLVSLPYEGCPDIILKPQGHMSFNGFIEICNRYDFRYYLKKDNLQKFKQYLDLK